MKENANTSYCARCHDHFECKANSTEKCWCSKVKLEKEVSLFISENYNDCLCVPCLVQLQRSFLIFGSARKYRKEFIQ